MNPTLIIAAIIAAGSFFGGWTVKSWQVGKQEAARVQQKLADQRLSAARDVRRLDNVITAQNQAEARARSLRVDADGSRTALVGLYAAVDETLRAGRASLDACVVRADTLGELFKDSERDYQQTSEKADRHANDVQKLTAAWPKE